MFFHRKEMRTRRIRKETKSSSKIFFVPINISIDEDTNRSLSFLTYPANSHLSTINFLFTYSPSTDVFHPQKVLFPKQVVHS